MEDGEKNMYYVTTIIYFPVYFIGNRRKTEAEKGRRGLLREARAAFGYLVLYLVL